jgi:AraC-like DNA-binding protein/mannose-6-phosphate isomerase-like protein (cupin superfamily)
MNPDKSDIQEDPALRRLGQRREAVQALDQCLKNLGAVIIPVMRTESAITRPGHFHPVPEVFLQLGGESRFFLPTETFSLVPGQILVMPAGLSHYEEPVQESLNLVVKILAGRCQYHLGRQARDVLPDAVPTDLEPCANRLLMEACQCAGVKERQILIEAWSILIRNLLAGPSPSEALSDPVLRTLVYIRENLADPACTAAAVAKHLGLSTDHLSRMLRVATGAGVQATLLEHRLLVATHLLTDPDRSIGEVAKACGFRDPEYFARAFRKRHGRGPRDWRSQRIRIATQGGIR